MRTVFFILFFLGVTYVRADTTTGLIAWWKFDEGTGATAIDSSGNGNTGTLQNNPTWVKGMRGMGLNLNGTSQYVSVTQNGRFNLHAQPFTIAFWVQDTTFPGSGYHRLISWYDGTNNIQIGQANNSGASYYYITNNNIQTLESRGTLNITDTNNPHHVAVTFDGNATYTMYVNGLISDTGGRGLSVLLFTGNSTTLYIGQRGDGQAYTQGLLDDVRIYNRALSAMDVYALYLNDDKIRGNAVLNNVQIK